MKIPILSGLAIAVAASAFYFVAEKNVTPAPSTTVDVPAIETAAPAAGSAMSSTDVAQFPATGLAPSSDAVAASGYRLEIDPATGEFIEPVQPSAPSVEEYPQEMQNTLSRSTDGLVTKTAPVGGGKMVDLQGRFQATYTATVDQNNKLVAGCDLPQTHDEEDQR